MKLTIEFKLPEHEEEFQTFIDGAKWRYVVREIDETMREMIKWNNENLDESQLLVVRQIRSILYVYMEQENLQLYK